MCTEICANYFNLLTNYVWTKNATNEIYYHGYQKASVNEKID